MESIEGTSRFILSAPPHMSNDWLVNVAHQWMPTILLNSTIVGVESFTEKRNATII